MDFAITRRVLEAMEHEGVDYVVIGGVALNLHGLARATEDLDVFIAARPDNIERLKAALRSVYDDPSIAEITAADLLGDYPAVQYVPPDGRFHIDILTRLGEAFRFEDLESQRLDCDGIEVTAATPGTLYRMKKGTVRPRDWDDARRLKQHFGLEED